MIYFDNAATTPVCPEAREAALYAMTECFGNPSSPHIIGLEAERLVKKAAEDISVVLGCSPEEIIFTSGGTESNNAAILGIIPRIRAKNGKRRVWISQFEHASVIQPLKILAEQGVVEYNCVSLGDIEWDTVDEFPDILCMTQAGSETGDCNDIGVIASAVKRLSPQTIIMADGAQGFCKMPFSLRDIDIYTFSAHKIRGIKGTGGLYIKRGTQINPLMFGGGQQSNLRPGTENTVGITAFSAAVRAQMRMQKEYYETAAHIKAIISSVAGELEDTHVNQLGKTSPFILNMSFVGIKGETLVHLLSSRSLCASMGAACRTGKKEISPLEAMGFSRKRAESAVRFSFSAMNTVDEAIAAKEIIKESVRELRDIRRRRNFKTDKKDAQREGL